LINWTIPATRQNTNFQVVLHWAEDFLRFSSKETQHKRLGSGFAGAE
jgi:hypothetical protein